MENSVNFSRRLRIHWQSPWYPWYRRAWLLSRKFKAGLYTIIDDYRTFRKKHENKLNVHIFSSENKPENTGSLPAIRKNRTESGHEQKSASQTKTKRKKNANRPLRASHAVSFFWGGMFASVFFLALFFIANKFQNSNGESNLSSVSGSPTSQDASLDSQNQNYVVITITPKPTPIPTPTATPTPTPEADFQGPKIALDPDFQDGTTYYTKNVCFQVNVSDNVTPTGQILVQWMLDYDGWSQWSTNHTQCYQALALGVHQIAVRAKDGSGNGSLTIIRKFYTEQKK